VPVLVGDLFDQAVHGLDLAAIERIAQLAAVNAQLTAQLPVLCTQVGKGCGLTHTELFQRGAGCVFGYLTSFFDGALESVS